MSQSPSSNPRRHLSAKRLAQLRRAGQAAAAARRKAEGDQWWYPVLSQGWAISRVKEPRGPTGQPVKAARFSFALYPADLRYLRALSERTGVSQSELVRFACARSLPKVAGNVTKAQQRAGALAGFIAKIKAEAKRTWGGE